MLNLIASFQAHKNQNQISIKNMIQFSQLRMILCLKSIQSYFYIKKTILAYNILVTKETDNLMTTIKLMKRQMDLHYRSSSSLTKTFYKKMNRRYKSPTQGVNATIIRQKVNSQERAPIMEAMIEQMGKQVTKLPIIFKSEQSLVLGINKNHIYCRKLGDKYENSSKQNLKWMQDHFLTSRYHKQIKRIKSKDKIELIRHSYQHEELPKIKNQYASI